MEVAGAMEVLVGQLPARATELAGAMEVFELARAMELLAGQPEPWNWPEP